MKSKKLFLLTLGTLFYSSLTASHASEREIEENLSKHVINLKPSKKSQYYDELKQQKTHKSIKIELSEKTAVKYPAVLDISSMLSNIYDQGQLGSCTAQATCAGIEYNMVDQKWGGVNKFTPSRLFQYYNSRSLMGTVNEDSGASIADAIKASYEYGFAPESLWNYSDNDKLFKVKPTKIVYDKAKEYRITHSKIPLNLDAFKYVINNHDGIVMGMSLFNSFMTSSAAKTGIIPMPKTDEDSVGGHAMLIVGYDDTQKMFKIRNSWGPNWGIKGHCLVPYEYVFGNEQKGLEAYLDEAWRINSIVETVKHK